MAVIPVVDSIKVQVLVNNVPLQEYSPDDDELELKSDDHDRLISKYIEAKSDVLFTVQAAIDERFQQLHKDFDLRIAFAVDGIHMASRLYYRREFLRGKLCNVAGNRYYLNGIPHEKAFKFSQLSIGKSSSAGKVYSF